MLVLTWNLFHGRAVPQAGRALLGEFAAALASWEWDVALLQEVPPWWPPALGRATGASERSVLTSRNQLLALRRAVAVRAPDLLKSGGGGANAILVRGDRIAEHRSVRLRRLPEGRFAHGARLAGGGMWVWNLHAQAHSEERAQADLARAAAVAVDHARDLPIVLGGDLNTRAPGVPGFTHAGGHSVDHVLLRGLAADGSARVLDHGRLSDHVPVVVDLGRIADDRRQ
jgi:endonuclease/exonuclease/phosphatase family metal-dependent hydrolase